MFIEYGTPVNPDIASYAQMALTCLIQQSKIKTDYVEY